MSNSLDPDQARHIVGSAQVQTVCKSYQKTILVGNELRVLLTLYILMDFPKLIDMISMG